MGRSRSKERGQSRKGKKHRRERSRSGSDRDKKEKRDKKGKRERSWSHSPISKGGRKGGGGRSRDRQYSSHRTGQYLSHERFDKGDSRVAWDKDKRDKYNHRGYQEK